MAEPLPKATRTSILVVVAVAAVAVLALRAARTPSAISAEAAPDLAAAALDTPRLIELGSTSCKSCKAMHEELTALRTECGESLGVDEIDVWRDEEAAKRYGVQVIPTQVFVDGNGVEFDRHVGYIPRGEIRQRFASLGVTCAP